jgi:hypothetical protein
MVKVNMPQRIIPESSSSFPHRRIFGLQVMVVRFTQAIHGLRPLGAFICVHFSCPDEMEQR